MTIRLPNPGQDDGQWGDLLNDFLLVEHNSQGVLTNVARPADVASKYTLPGSGIPKAHLSAAVQQSLDNADAAVNATAPDATTTAHGVIRLNGDLTGTADSPLIASGVIDDSNIASAAAISQSKINGLTTALTGKADTAHTHTESDITGLTGDLAGKVGTARQITAGTGLTGGGDLTADRTLSVSYGVIAGTAAQGNDSRITGALQSGASAGGDLSGTLPSPSVAKVNGVGVSGTPSTGYVITATGSTAATWQAPTYPITTVTAGNLGAAYTLACGSKQKVIMTGTLNANCTITVSGMVAGTQITMVLTKDATATAYTLAFSPVAKTPGGLGLDLSSTASAIDIITLFSPDGTTLYAFPSGGNMQ